MKKLNWKECYDLLCNPPPGPWEPLESIVDLDGSVIVKSKVTQKVKYVVEDMRAYEKAVLRWNFPQWNDSEIEKENSDGKYHKS